MRKSLLSIAAGALMLIGGMAGRIVLPEHKPAISCDGPCYRTSDTTAHLSHTLYDALRITTWALLIVGALLVVLGLINYARR